MDFMSPPLKKLLKDAQYLTMQENSKEEDYQVLRRGGATNDKWGFT